MKHGHISLSGSYLLAAFWHWAYWDLNVFVTSTTGSLVLDLNQILGIHKALFWDNTRYFQMKLISHLTFRHLLLASVLCFGFGLAHLTHLFNLKHSGFQGPGIWTSDSFGLFSDWLSSILLWCHIIKSHCSGILWSKYWFVAYLIKTYCGISHQDPAQDSISS